jgi:predicted lipoprotein with Yx(FWY)xxD motif
MRRTTALAVAAASAAAWPLLAGCGGGTKDGASAGSVPTPGAVLATRTQPNLGLILVNGSARTVYSAEQESNGMIACTGGCLDFWSPVTESGGSRAAPDGAPGTVATVRRSDTGATQLTYDGRPLYTFRLDRSSSDVRGNGLTDSFDGRSFTWRAVVVSAATGATGAPPSAGGGAATGNAPDRTGSYGY